MKDKEIRRKAYGHFQSGYLCAEAISRTVGELFSEELPADVLRCSSGFCGGVGGSSEELCGAFTGGVIVVSYFLGREDPGDTLRDCGVLIKEFRKRFLQKFGSLQCKTILKGFNERGKNFGCLTLTGEASVMLAGILRAFEKQRATALNDYRFQKREKSDGYCPFGGSSMQTISAKVS